MIKNRKDVRDYLTNEEYKCLTWEGTYNQVKGRTVIKRDPDPHSNSWLCWSFGHGWADQAPKLLNEDEALALVWKHRAAINKDLKDPINHCP